MGRLMKIFNIFLALILVMGITGCASAPDQTATDTSLNSENSIEPISQSINFSVVDTGQIKSYNNQQMIQMPGEGESFYGQDSCFTGNEPSYTDNGDGTITDNITGLMWQKDPGDKMTYSDAVSGALVFSLAGYSDSRLPTIKELYSLILFSGTDPQDPEGDGDGAIPFIDTNYFNFE